MRHNLSLLLGCACLVGCGSNQATSDAGRDVDVPGQDANACPDAGADPSLANAKPPVGTQLLQGDDLSIRGVTSDGFVIYSDNVTQTLHAIRTTGGVALDLGALGPKYWVTVNGAVAFIWTNVSGSNVGALSTWSNASGLHPVGTASFGLVATPSPNGDRVLYVDHMDSAGSRGDIYVASIDGTNAVKLVPSAYIAGCYPELAFVGAYVVVSHCDAQPNTLPTTTISSFTVPGWARADLVTGAEDFFWANASTGQVLASNAPGIYVIPIGGGPKTTIDAQGFWGSLSSDGTTALYDTMSQAMRRSSTTAPAPTTIIPNSFGGFWSVSPDEKWMLYFNNLGTVGGDMYMASTLTPGLPVTLSPTLNAGLVGDAFTANSSYAIYTAGVDPCSQVGALQVLAAGSSTPQKLGDAAWVDWSLGDSKLVFADNFFPTGGARFGRADVEWIDLSQGMTPTRMVDRADAVIGLSPNADQLIYVWSAQPGSQAGMYAAPFGAK